MLRGAMHILPGMQEPEELCDQRENKAGNKSTGPCLLLAAPSVFWYQRKNGHLLQHLKYATDTSLGEENKFTVENLSKLSVDIKKIRRLKPWVLSKEVSYIKEIANILQTIGADGPSLAHMFESYPEAILCSPINITCQRDLWLSVCQNEKQLVELIKRFPDAFFNVEHYENQKANIRFFKALGLKNAIIRRFLTTSVLKERLDELLKEGISIEEIKELPAVLELSTEIIQYRIKKLNALGYSLKNGTLKYLNGTKKDFETTYGKIQAKNKGTLLEIADPTAVTLPVTTETLPLTNPTPMEGTAVTAVLVTSKLFPPIHATPPIVAPTAPLVMLKRPPVTRSFEPHTMKQS
ncbi:mTERF domain-containing protein 3, mitochondrial, partial [Ophiophagus hannah]